MWSAGHDRQREGDDARGGGLRGKDTPQLLIDSPEETLLVDLAASFYM